ncbi:cytochrome c oxidase subunit II [Bosea sp. (in: a-proteobacteria)]|uniref:cytochrome c oxidase subunit II n=1 Tax=Bosea sp. (in: a-proteobacteria) TaxID=1871050 RepID=UPI0027356770|nr:cytochrome c oxidase subunit II [Bosea sp. (in: a-proteobacteria)]MDP3411190.1 cytochrome c oxidase subunit II [Bosea sp. (in: a-proteobacteria)]
MLLGALALGGCGGRLSALDPAGPAADSTLTLFLILLGLAALSFVIIFGIFLLALRRNRGRTVSLRLFIIGGGLVFPLVLLSFATVYGVVLGERITGAREVPALTVAATAQQWRWQFTRQTPGGSVTRADILDIPAGQTVAIMVASTDVIHAFWVPRLAGKVDAIPGLTNRILIRADVPGRYGGVCAEFCGTGHTGMDFTVVAHDAEAWAALETGGQP